MKRFILLLVVFSSWTLHGFTQSQSRRFKDERRTNLWDVTLSMKGYNGAPDIYDTVVEALTKDIQQISNPRTEVVVIPFQDGPYCEVWRANATPDGKQNLARKIKEYSNKDTTNTNIALPLQYVMDHIFTEDRIDVLKLMTDGKTQTPDQLDRVLNGWCDVAQAKDVYGFYIILTSAAWDERVVKKLNDICRFEAIEGTRIDEIVSIFPAESVSLNLRDDFDKPLTIKLTPNDGSSIPNNFKLHVRCEENPYVAIDEWETVANNQITIQPRFLKPQAELLETVRQTPSEVFHLQLESDTELFPLTRLLSNVVYLELINKPEKTLKFDVK